MDQCLYFFLTYLEHNEKGWKDKPLSSSSAESTPPTEPKNDREESLSNIIDRYLRAGEIYPRLDAVR